MNTFAEHVENMPVGMLVEVMHPTESTWRLLAKRGKVATITLADDEYWVEVDGFESEGQFDFASALDVAVDALANDTTE